MNTIVHEPWFLSEPVEEILKHAKPLLFSEWSAFTVIVVLGFIALLIAAFAVHFFVYKTDWMKRFTAYLSPWYVWTPIVLRTMLGGVMVISALDFVLFFPDLHFEPISFTNQMLIKGELAIGLLLLIGVYPRVVSAFGLALFISLFAFVPAITLVHYLVVPGIFLFLLIHGDPTLPHVARKKSHSTPHALPLLRFGLAISLIVASLWNKIIHPQFALAFLETHPFTMFGLAGEKLVLILGLVEIFLGLLVLIGIYTRLTALALFAAFTCGIGLLGIYELIYHLPFYAAAFALLTGGPGKRWSFEREKV